jgi:hypothetical protein
VEEAAKLAQLHSTVMQMPNGYNTMVGDRSEENLSDGQTQRLSLVRFRACSPAQSALALAFYECLKVPVTDTSERPATLMQLTAMLVCCDDVSGAGLPQER